MYALGLLTGLVIAVLFFTILASFRQPIERVIKSYEKVLRSDEMKGDIIMPISDAEEVRQARIKENQEKGLDTYFDELV